VTGPGDVVVRPATPADAAVVQQLSHRAYAEHADLVPTPKVLSETIEVVAAELAEQGGLVAEVGGVVVGSIRHGIEEDGRRWLRRVSVDPDIRRHGVGTALVKAAVAVTGAVGAPGLHLAVRHALPHTRAWYQRLGFLPVREHALWWHLAAPSPLRLADAVATRQLGVRLAELARDGDLVILAGPLGAGKTTLAQGFGAGLGVEGPVRSPTYTLADQHSGTALKLVHIDAYRLGSAEELDDLDLDLDGAVALVEWGEDRAEQLATSRLVVRLERPPLGDGPDHRTVRLEPVGGDWARRMSAARLL
jgi:tRNA threonylcarbamoyladenosine biosynthesis protein TsaE